MATIAEELGKAAVTDSLNRTESPVGAPWVKINPGTSAGRCTAVAPAGYTPVTSFAGGEDDCYWSTSAFASTASKYIYAIFTLSRIGSNERQTGVWLCRDEAAPVTTQNGYLLRLERKVGANEIKFTIEKWVGGAAEVIKEVTTTSFIAGAKIALVVGNGKAYLFASATEGGSFEEQMSVETSTYSKGYSGMRAKGTGEFIVKDFRTGTFEISAATAAPEVITEEATEVGKEKAKLNGSVDANGGPAKYYFRYCRAETQFVVPEGGTGVPIATDGTWIYFGNNQAGQIGRVKLDGTELNSKWVNVATATRGLAVQGGFIYYTDSNNNRIGKVKTDGTELNKEFIKEPGEPRNLVASATNLYWTNEGISFNGIGRATLAGGEVTKEWLLAGKAAASGGIAINATHIFWIGFSKIGRATIAGGTIEESWVTGLVATAGLAVDAEALYFGNTNEDAVGRVRIDGTELLNKWLRGPGNARNFLSTSEALYWGEVDVFKPAIGRAKYLYAPTSKEGNAGSGAEPAAVSENLTGLAQGTEYIFQLRASNEKGETTGSWKSLLTSGAGVVSILVGGVIKNVKRWVLVKGALVQK